MARIEHSTPPPALTFRIPRKPLPSHNSTPRFDCLRAGWRVAKDPPLPSLRSRLRNAFCRAGLRSISISVDLVALPQEQSITRPEDLLVVQHDEPCWTVTPTPNLRQSQRTHVSPTTTRPVVDELLQIDTALRAKGSRWSGVTMATTCGASPSPVSPIQHNRGRHCFEASRKDVAASSLSTRSQMRKTPASRRRQTSPVSPLSPSSTDRFAIIMPTLESPLTLPAPKQADHATSVINNENGLLENQCSNPAQLAALRHYKNKSLRQRQREYHHSHQYHRSRTLASITNGITTATANITTKSQQATRPPSPSKLERSIHLFNHATAQLQHLRSPAGLIELSATPPTPPPKECLLPSAPLSVSSRPFHHTGPFTQSPSSAIPRKPVASRSASPTRSLPRGPATQSQSSPHRLCGPGSRRPTETPDEEAAAKLSKINRVLAASYPGSAPLRSLPSSSSSSSAAAAEAAAKPQRTKQQARPLPLPPLEVRFAGVSVPHPPPKQQRQVPSATPTTARGTSTTAPTTSSGPTTRTLQHTVVEQLEPKSLAALLSAPPPPSQRLSSSSPPSSPQDLQPSQAQVGSPTPPSLFSRPRPNPNSIPQPRTRDPSHRPRARLREGVLLALSSRLKPPSNTSTSSPSASPSASSKPQAPTLQPRRQQKIQFHPQQQRGPSRGSSTTTSTINARIRFILSAAIAILALLVLDRLGRVAGAALAPLKAVARVLGVIVWGL